jgi:multidrug resistance efflux pump
VANPIEQLRSTGLLTAGYRTSKRTKLLVLGVCLAAVGVGLYRASLFGDEGAAWREYVVERRRIGSSLRERGWLVSLDSEQVETGATGDILEIADLGTRVKKGDVVIRIEDTQARERLDEVNFNTLGARQTKAQSEADYDYIACVESNTLLLLTKRLETAKLEEEEARNGLKPEDRRLLDIELKIGKLDLEDARDELGRQRRLLAKGFISQAMFEPYERRLATLEANVMEIEARIRIEEKGVPPELLLELEGNVTRIQGLLDRGEKSMHRRLEYVQRQIDEGGATLAENLHDLAQVEEELAAMEVRSPKGGVLSIRGHYERQVGRWMQYRPGSKVSKHDRVADIVNPGKVTVEIMLHEADIDRVLVGTQARIALPAYPGRVFTGEILEIGGVGRDRADVAPRGFEHNKAGVVMFNATVSLNGNGVEFRPGMSAIVELIVEMPTAQLVLNRAAVRRDGESFCVLQRKGGQVQQVTIEGRVLNESSFAVTAGLEEGDAVVVKLPGEDA